MTLYSVKQRCKRSPLANWRSSIRQPLFKTRCQTSIPQRHEYHWTRSMATSTVSTATVVNSSHSMGVTSVGGSTSWTWTAHSATAGKPSRWRWRGGHSVKGQNRSANVASRAACGPRRGTCKRRWSLTGCASTVAHTVIFQNKCDWVDETSKTYGRPRCRKNATESFHSATGLILSTFNATELNQNFIYHCN